MSTVHKPVLLQEVLAGLNLKQGMTVVDCTVNAAGHAYEMGKRIGKSGTVIGIDADSEAIARARERLGQPRRSPEAKSGSRPKASGLPTAHLFLGNFRKLGEYLDTAGVEQVDAVLLDLGLSSDQLESSGRGFTFQKDEPLSMAFSGESELTAVEIVNDWEEESLADIIWGFGGERSARRIARGIVAAREQAPIERSQQLAEIVSRALPAIARHGKIHPATKTFQALRMTVNDELGALRDVLPQAWAALAPEGRLAVITFHSLEDRIVKNFMREHTQEGRGTLILKKPITPTREEIQDNPRARSAKLRIIQKTPQQA